MKLSCTGASHGLHQVNILAAHALFQLDEDILVGEDRAEIGAGLDIVFRDLTDVVSDFSAQTRAKRCRKIFSSSQSAWSTIAAVLRDGRC